MFSYNIYKFAKLFSYAAQGLVSSLTQAARILGVSPTAGPEEINKAYKEKAKKLHPDLNPDADPIEMKMLNSAKEIMLSTKDEIEQDGSSPNMDDFDPYPSYEEIAEMRRTMGRDKFKEQFGDWETELKREMGLDEWNRIFEHYAPNENSYDDYQSDRMWDALSDQAYDIAYDLFLQAKEDNKLDITTRAKDLIKIYPNLMKIPEWVIKHNMTGAFEKAVDEAFTEKLLDNAKDLNIILQEMLDFPNIKVIEGFLAHPENFDKEVIPDSFLQNKTFIHAFVIFFPQSYENLECGLKFLEQYGTNKNFLSGLSNHANLLYFIGSKDTELNKIAKKHILDLPFTPEQKQKITHWMNRKH